MEIVVSLMTAEAVGVPLAVKSLYNGGLMRLTESHGSVLIVESLCTNCLKVYGITNVLRLNRLTAAVYGKYPSCVATVGQDWAGWLDAGLVDYVVPMDYTEDPARFEELLRQQSASKSRARRTIVGIGVTANESRLDARQVIEQINLVRRHGLAGESLFDLDVTLEKSILPYLSLGIW